MASALSAHSVARSARSVAMAPPNNDTTTMASSSAKIPDRAGARENHVEIEKDK